MRQIVANSAGQSCPDVQSGSTSGPPAARPLPGWITSELIADTQRVWTRHLRRVVTEEEAIEMLKNVRHAAMTILRAGNGAAE